MSTTPTPGKPAMTMDTANAAGDMSSGDTPRPRRNGGTRYALWSLVILAVVAAGGYYLWRQLQVTRQEVSTGDQVIQQKLDDLAGRVVRLEQLAQQVAAQQGNIDSLQSQQQSLEKMMGMLRNEAAGGARTWDVEEVAVLLQIANDRLRLEYDVAPSLAALESADSHLRQLKNPALLEVRRLLAEEINALRAIANPDIPGMALSLGAIIDGIDRLPLASGEPAREPAAADTETGWRGVFRDLFEKLKSLVVIKRRGENDLPLLAPDERYFLRQNLRLSLEAARVALLRRDDPAYHSSLRDAQQWISRYFDNEAPAAANALKELSRLRQTDIAPNLPDISGSLNALQSWLSRQSRWKAKVSEPTRP